MKDQIHSSAAACVVLLAISCAGSSTSDGETRETPSDGREPGDGDGSGGASSGGMPGSGGSASGGASGSGGEAPANGGAPATGGQDGSGGTMMGSGGEGTGGADGCTDSGAAQNMSFFVTSYHHMTELSGSVNGFGGDLRYGGAESGLEGADAICQESARRVCHGDKTWRAFLSTSTVDARDRIGSGPWHDYMGSLVAENLQGLIGHDRPAGGCCDAGTYDELGTLHDGHSDVNNDGLEDDDHDVITASTLDGTYAGFSCDDWTTTLTNVPQGQFIPGVYFGHMWPASSGASWISAHAGFGCGAGTNFIHDTINSASIGGGGGYGALYCFAID